MFQLDIDSIKKKVQWAMPDRHGIVCPAYVQTYGVIHSFQNIRGLRLVSGQRMYQLSVKFIRKVKELQTAANKDVLVFRQCVMYRPDV